MKKFIRLLRYFPLIAIITFLVMFPQFVYCQTASVYTSNGRHVQIKNSLKGSSKVISRINKISSEDNQDNVQEKVRLIVMLKEQPLSVYNKSKSILKKSSVTSSYSTLQTSHSLFKASLDGVKQKLSVQSKSVYDYKINYEYYRALNGVAMECNRGMIGKIRALPMVKYVGIDEEVKINETLKESIGQIRADKVQDSLGYKGKGVVVGLIDTGIDYFNSALGGGFGPTYRVIGGHDFVNKDNNPIDDNGHGTHVAGIIGASRGNVLRGVAPEVKFIAAKVLDAKGSGYYSTIIAGIEYCLDPDGDPSTDDAVDIINMSLGGLPIPKSPLDSAVNNATKAGVLSVVAAGNDGQSGFGTIGSPGTSESALTVGACDSINQVAYFSSEGPDAINSLIKPEIIAPGVKIFSTVLDDMMAGYSGTSMATPHVTGVAALLKQEHPYWTPQQLKAAIINSAKAIADSSSLFVKGNGRVDALSAASLGLLAEPGTLNFGRANLALTVWNDTIAFTIKNVRKSKQHIALQSGQDLPAGASLNINKTVFDLLPEEETTLTAILSVPNSVPLVLKEPYSYTGNIICMADSDKIRIPFAFFKSSTIVVNCDIQPYNLLIWSPNSTYTQYANVMEGVNKYFLYVPTGLNLNLSAALQKDTLDIKTNYLIDHGNITSNGLTYVFINHEEAAYKVLKDSLFDINGKPFSTDSSEYIFEALLNRMDSQTEQQDGFIFDFFPHNSQMYVSNFDSLYRITQILRAQQGKNVLALNKISKGVSSQKDITFPSGPDNLTNFNINFGYINPAYENKKNYVKQLKWGYKTWETWNLGKNWNVSTNEFGSIFSFLPSANFMISKNLNEADNPHFNASEYFGFAYIDLLDGFLEPLVYGTQDIGFSKEGNAFFHRDNYWWSNSLPVYSKDFIYEYLNKGDTLNLKNDIDMNIPVFGLLLNDSGISLTANRDGCLRSWFYENGGTLQPDGQYENRDAISEIYYKPKFTATAISNNKKLSSVNTGNYYTYKVKNLTTACRVMAYTNPYKLLGQSGQCTIDFESLVPAISNWPKDGYVFPSINLLQITCEGKPVKWVRPGQEGIIRFMIADTNKNITSVNLVILLPSGNEISLPTTSVFNHEYTAVIPDYIPAGFIDLIVRVKDAKGNKFEMTATPAFYYGSTMNNVQFDSRLRMNSYKMTNTNAFNFNTGDTLNYKLSFLNYGNITAKNINISLPSTPYFKIIGAGSITRDSLGASDTMQVTVKLQFLGKQQPTDLQAYYYPSITWNSNGNPYLRKSKVLVSFAPATTTGVSDEENLIPKQYSLSQNYPNPFNPTTNFKYSIPKSSKVVLKLFDILGREVATLVNEVKAPGNYNLLFDASKLSSGVYLYQLRADGFNQTKKMMFIK